MIFLFPLVFRNVSSRISLFPLVSPYFPLYLLISSRIISPSSARKIVKLFIENENFDSDMVNLKRAVNVAKELVEQNLNQ